MLKRTIELVINTALLLYAHAVWVLALLLAGDGVAFAQDMGLIPGVPAEYQAAITVALGLLSAALIGPLTAIAKKLGRTSGPTTVGVSAVLSLIVAVGFALIQAAATREDVAWTAALWIAVLGFIRSNGAYISSVFAQVKGVAGLPAPTVVVGEVQAPADLKSPPPSGFEDSTLPAAFTPSTQPLGLFGGPLVEATLGMLLEGVLKQLNLPATADNVARLAVKLIKVFPDLADGNFHLNWRNRADILEASHELMDMGGLK